MYRFLHEIPSFIAFTLSQQALNDVDKKQYYNETQSLLKSFQSYFLGKCLCVKVKRFFVSLLA